MNRDSFATMLGKLPKPDWFSYYTQATIRTMHTARWGHNLRNTNLPVFNRLYARYLSSGKIDLNDPDLYLNKESDC